MTRYAVCLSPWVALLAGVAYGPLGLVVVPLILLPGAAVSIGFVAMQPAVPRPLGRVASIVVSGALSYAGAAIVQSLADGSGIVDYWSASWAVTFFAATTGLTFGSVAILASHSHLSRSSVSRA